MIYAAKLERFASGLERHSYDTEVAAYLDVCARLPDHTRALCVTDCLSGASADVRTPTVGLAILVTLAVILHESWTHSTSCRAAYAPSITSRFIHTRASPPMTLSNSTISPSHL